MATAAKKVPVKKAAPEKVAAKKAPKIDLEKSLKAGKAKATQPVPEKAAQIKGFKVPAQLGACADLIYELRQQKSAAKKVVDEFDAKISVLQIHLINNLPKSEASGVSGRLANVSVTSKQVPTVTDWDAVFEYVHKNKSYDMLQRRLSDAAVQARWEDGKKIPGVEPYEAKSLSITKI